MIELLTILAIAGASYAIGYYRGGVSAEDIYLPIVQDQDMRLSRADMTLRGLGQPSVWADQ